MTTVNRERLIITLINTAIMVIAMFLILSFQNKKYDSSTINKEIQSLQEKKADIDYVDKSDEKLRKEIIYKFDTQEKHFDSQFGIIIEMLKEQREDIRNLNN